MLCVLKKLSGKKKNILSITLGVSCGCIEKLTKETASFPCTYVNSHIHENTWIRVFKY